jgi:protein-S-isoprenylcysteine O-methyltransferase Ste14
MSSAEMDKLLNRSVQKKPETAKVKVFPPGLFLAAIILGFGINFVLPVKLLPTPIQLGAGIPIVVISVFLAGVTFREFFKHGTSSDHKKAAKVLITTGPFGLSRNPLYLSGAVLVIGMAVLLDSVWILGLLLPVIITVRQAAILPEEKYLVTKFGAQYLNYKSRVRRWL